MNQKNPKEEKPSSSPSSAGHQAAKIKARRIVRFVFLLVACLVILANFGKHTESPFSFSTEVIGAHALDDEETGLSFGDDSFAVLRDGVAGAVVDDGCTRLIFLNDRSEAVSISEGKLFDDSAQYYQDIEITDDAFYVLSYEKCVETGYLDSQRIYSYDLNGKNCQVAWERSFGGKKSRIRSHRVFSLDETSNGDILAVVADESDTHIDVIGITGPNQGTTVKSFDLDLNQEAIFDAEYNSAADTLGVVSSVGTLRIYRNGEVEQIRSKGGNADLISYVKLNDDGSFIPLDAKNKSANLPATIPFSPQFALWTLLFWASVAYVAITLLVYLIMKARVSTRRERGTTVRRAIGVFVSVAITFGISVYYSYQLGETSATGTTETLSVLARNLQIAPHDFLRDKLGSVKGIGEGGGDGLPELARYLEGLKANNAQSGVNADYSVLKSIEGKPNNVVLAYSTNPNIWRTDWSGMPLSDYMKELESDDTVVTTTVGTTRSAYIIALGELTDNAGSLLGYVLISSDMQLLISNIIAYTLQVFVKLLAAIVTIVFLLIEVRAFLKSRRRHKRFLLEEIPHPEIAYARTFTFLSAFFNSFDAALAVLIAKDMLSAQSNVEVSALLGIPAFALSLGLALGSPLFSVLSKRLNIRVLLTGNCICAIVGYLGCFFAVATSNFWLYCNAIFMAACFSGIFHATRYHLPLLSHTEKARYGVNNNSALSRISGAAISVALAGTIAEMLGSEWIYALILIPLALMFILVLKMFPRGKRYHAESRGSAGRIEIKSKVKEYLRILSAPAFLVFVVFLMSTDALTSGYKALIFPIIMDDAGVSKAMIGNLVAFANFTVFLVNGAAERLLKKVGFFEGSIWCAVSMGVFFASFMINDSVAWSVLALALIFVAAKVSDVCNEMIWPHFCREKGYSEHTANMMIQVSTSVEHAISSVVIGALLVFGTSVASFCLGFYLLIGSGLFFMLARNTGFKKKTDDNRQRKGATQKT